MGNLIIRADASKTIGFGHFIRSLALAGYLKDDFECHFCTFNLIEHRPSEYQLAEISKVAQYVPIEANCYEEYDSQFMNALKGHEIVVLDNYYFSSEYQKGIREKGCKLVCVGPVKDRHYVADAVITSGHKPRSAFSFEPYTVYLNGLEHAFLREPFLHAGDKSKMDFGTFRIVLCIGGADPFGLTNKLIRDIIESSPKCQVSVIAGDTVEIDRKFLDKIKVFRRLEAEQIVKLFSKSDLGIFSASTICIEALACRLPVAAGWYVDNQEDFYHFGVKEGYFLPLGNLLDNETHLKTHLRHILNSPVHRLSNEIDFLKGKEDIIELFKNL